MSTSAGPADTSSKSRASKSDASKDTGKGKATKKSEDHMDEDGDDEEDSDEDENDDEDDDEDEEEEEDSFEEIDPSVITSRRTRGVKVDYTSPEALAKAGLKPGEVEEDSDDEMKG